MYFPLLWDLVDQIWIRRPASLSGKAWKYLMCFNESVYFSDIWAYSFWTRNKDGVIPPTIVSEQIAKPKK